MRKHLLISTAIVGLVGANLAQADQAAADRFLAGEIAGLSVLNSAQQKSEMKWFIDAAKPYKGMKIKVVSETIGTH